MLDILKQYFIGIVHYWWLLMFGLLGAVNTAYKWFHPERKDLPIPHWLRVYSAIGVLVIAQFLLYRDSIKNLSTVIADKQSCNSDNWRLKQQVTAMSTTPSSVTPHVKSQGSSALPSRTSLRTEQNQSAPSTSNTSTSPTQSVPTQNVTQTQLESLTQLNKNLPSGDRERLSNALYDFAQALEKIAAVGYKLNRWSGQLNADMQNNLLEKTFAEQKKN